MSKEEFKGLEYYRNKSERRETFKDYLILGALAAIAWSITLIVLIRYIID